MTAAGSFGFLAGISRSFSSWRTTRRSRLFAGSPGTRAGPESPPLRSAARESIRSPPFNFSDVALWHS